MTAAEAAKFDQVGAMVVIDAVLIMRPVESEWAMPTTLLRLAASCRSTARSDLWRQLSRTLSGTSSCVA